MFGIGFGEFVLIAMVLLIAIGPKKMPTFFKSVGKAMREFQRASRELRETIGIDEVLRDDDLRYPLRTRPKPLPRPAAAVARDDATVVARDDAAVVARDDAAVPGEAEAGDVPDPYGLPAHDELDDARDHDDGHDHAHGHEHRLGHAPHSGAAADHGAASEAGRGPGVGGPRAVDLRRDGAASARDGAPDLDAGSSVAGGTPKERER